jgi:hypothetical protein
VSQSLENLLDEAMRDGVASDADVRAVRFALYGERAEVGEAFGLLYEADKRRKTHSPEWSRLFVEAALDVALNETPPRGHFPPEKAQKVMEALGERGELRSDTVLEALVAIVEKADDVPPQFAAFVLRRVKETLIYSDGPTASGERLTPGAVGAPELALLRRVVWGAGAEGRLAVSRDEAEALFDIADATAGAANVASWDEFFAGAVGNYLIGATGRRPPSRERAFEMWEAPHKADALGALASIFTRAREVDFHDIQGDMRRHRLSSMVEESYRADNAARARAMAEAERLSGEKADWIVDRIRRNGALSAPESALLRFLEKEAASLPDALRGMAAQTHAAG